MDRYTTLKDLLSDTILKFRGGGGRSCIGLFKHIERRGTPRNHIIVYTSKYILYVSYVLLLLCVLELGGPPICAGIGLE